MDITTILSFLVKHKKIAAGAILSLCIALIALFGVNTYKKNLKLSEQLEMAQNNIEAYQDALSGSQQAFGVLKMDMTKLSEQKDSLLIELDNVRKKNKIKAKDVTTAATQTQNISVIQSKEVKEDIITILKDTVYTDSMNYNALTKVHYSIGTDSVKIRLDLKNTQYLYVYRKKEYKNKKSFIKRLLTFDWKKVYKYKYDITNTNDLINTSDVRVIESIDK